MRKLFFDSYRFDCGPIAAHLSLWAIYVLWESVIVDFCILFFFFFFLFFFVRRFAFYLSLVLLSMKTFRSNGQDWRPTAQTLLTIFWARARASRLPNRHMQVTKTPTTSRRIVNRSHIDVISVRPVSYYYLHDILISTKLRLQKGEHAHELHARLHVVYNARNVRNIDAAAERKKFILLAVGTSNERWQNKEKLYLLFCYRKQIVINWIEIKTKMYFYHMWRKRCYDSEIVRNA